MAKSNKLPFYSPLRSSVITRKVNSSLISSLIILIILWSFCIVECVLAKQQSEPLPIAQSLQSSNNSIQFKDISIRHEERYLPPSIYSNLLSNVIKYLVRMVFSKTWTAESALQRLDNLKKRLLSYYATKVEFEARDKGFGFPSLEGALLSLAFLTLSVALIDLIQILLGKLRMKKASAPTAAPATVYLGRQFLPIPYSSTTEFSTIRNSTDDLMTTLSSKVLSAIEKPTSFTSRS